MKKICSLLALFGYTQLWAQSSTETHLIASFHEVLIGVILVLSFVLILVVYTLMKVVYVLQKEVSGEPYDHSEELTGWEKLLSLKPLSAEKEIELDHNYDGIRELNNPIPPWFNVLFYGTILFGLIYLVAYHVIDIGTLQAKEYENEMSAAKIAKEEYLAKAGNSINESNVTLVSDAAMLQNGQELFISKCAVCHGDQGEGKVGPNLTDKYWLHGGSIQDIFKTIKYGVPAKGMVAWENSLRANEIQNLSSYIITLQGTVANGKEPQGQPLETSSTVVDSNNMSK
jgi:cytochrome c oxidase cbb3-type subunit 3